MNFYRVPQKAKNPDGNKYSVYMENYGKNHYVSDFINSDDDAAAVINKQGLTLRARLTRSHGAYAMLEGEVFNPDRLLSAACDITGYAVEPFMGGIYKDGYTLLTVKADGCVNKYLIFSESKLKSLVTAIKAKTSK